MENETRRTKWNDYPHYGCAAYRIWLRKTPHGMFQRHEWRMADGSERMDDWIASSGSSFGPTFVEEASS